MRSMWRQARKAVIVGASTVTFAALAAGQASAQNVSCNTTITQDTKLTSDLIDCTDDGIIIGAPNITLDLNGHVIDGDKNSTTLGAGVDNEAGHARVVIKNGEIRQFTEGIGLANAERNHLKRLWVSQNVQAGIELADSDRNWIERNTVFNNGEGIGLGQTAGGGGDGSDRNLIERNVALGNDGEGVAFENDADMNRVTRSMAAFNQYGILVDGLDSQNNRVDRNIADMNRQQGFLVSDATTFVRRNFANRNGDYGIEAPFGAIDGGGNRAADNGNSAGQCLGVVCS